jgi:SAM-dependent methyltransferase
MTQVVDSDAGEQGAAARSEIDRQLAGLAALGDSSLAAQKIADFDDFNDPRLRYVIQTIFGFELYINARVWEFAKTFDLMASRGVLAHDKRGVSFGSGREIILYHVARAVAHLTVTDLYTADTSWLEARAADASAFVLDNPPVPVDPARLSAFSMDARDLAFPDASFDFAYSISAFEHFGDDADLVRHLREVRRVLRDDGCYFLTTEMCFAAQTRRTTGNYAFTVPHLLELIAEAGLAADPVVDLSLQQRRENVGVDIALTHDYGMSQSLEQVMVWRELGGLVTGPICLVLRPATGSEAAPRLDAMAETGAWLTHRQMVRAHERFIDWVRLNPFATIVAPEGRRAILWSHDASSPPPSLLFSTLYNFFLDGMIEVHVTLAAMPRSSVADTGLGRVVIAVNAMLRSDPHQIAAHHVEPEQVIAAGGVIHVRFRFVADRDHSYAILGHSASATMPIMATIDIVAKRV